MFVASPPTVRSIAATPAVSARDLFPGILFEESSRQKAIVAGVLVADVGPDRQIDSPGSKPFAADERPTLPLCFRQACAAISVSTPTGAAGYSARILRAKASRYSASRVSRRLAAASRLRSLSGASASHSPPAWSRAACVTRTPCRSHLFLARLKLSTGYFFPVWVIARRVSAASPEPRNTRVSTPAHRAQTGLPASSLMCSPRHTGPEHLAHWSSRLAMKTASGFALSGVLMGKGFPCRQE